MQLYSVPLLLCLIPVSKSTRQRTRMRTPACCSARQKLQTTALPSHVKGSPLNRCLISVGILDQACLAWNKPSNNASTKRPLHWHEKSDASP